MTTKLLKEVRENKVSLTGRRLYLVWMSEGDPHYLPVPNYAIQTFDDFFCLHTIFQYHLGDASIPADVFYIILGQTILGRKRKTDDNEKN